MLAVQHRTDGLFWCEETRAIAQPSACRDAWPDAVMWMISSALLVGGCERQILPWHDFSMLQRCCPAQVCRSDVHRCPVLIWFCIMISAITPANASDDGMCLGFSLLTGCLFQSWHCIVRPLSIWQEVLYFPDGPLFSFENKFLYFKRWCVCSFFLFRVRVKEVICRCRASHLCLSLIWSVTPPAASSTNHISAPRV